MASKAAVEELAARIRPLLAGEDGVAEKRMFGGIGVLVNGNLSVSASGQGGLMVRCDPAQTNELTSEPGVARVVMRGRQMEGWLRVDPTVIGSAESLARWVRVGAGYARTLPAKD